MEEIKQGTLVRVHNPINDNERKVLEEEGYLWLYERLMKNRDLEGNDLHICRSLATGLLHPWYTSEIEVLDDEAV